MSVLIRGMEMPERCGDCPFCLSYSDTDNDELKNWGHCTVTGLEADLDDACGECWGCPLVELPSKHGRLIDCDALVEIESTQYSNVMKDGQRDWFEKCIADLIHKTLEVTLTEKNAPTVLEAEGVD